MKKHWNFFQLLSICIALHHHRSLNGLNRLNIYETTTQQSSTAREGTHLDLDVPAVDDLHDAHHVIEHQAQLVAVVCRGQPEPSVHRHRAGEHIVVRTTDGCRTQNVSNHQHFVSQEFKTQCFTATAHTAAAAAAAAAGGRHNARRRSKPSPTLCILRSLLPHSCPVYRTSHR